MNKDLIELLKIYATKKHKDVSLNLIEKSKDSLIAMFLDLLTTYINDKNSSTLREFITVNLAGYEHSSGKIGYNGYKHNSLIAGNPIKCEAKPKNFDIEELERYKKKERKTVPQKLNGGGNFTDYTLNRFEKDKKENPNMLISGFVNGRLIYLFEFSFNLRTFSDRIKKQLDKYFPNGDRLNTYLRSANFDYKDFYNSEVKIIYLLDKKELQEYKNYIVKDFFLWMTSKAK